MVVAEVDFDLIEVARAKAPLLADLKGSWDVLSRLMRIE
jgi:hypothetical protein